MPGEGRNDIAPSQVVSPSGPAPGVRARPSVRVALAFAVVCLALPVSLPAQVLTAPAARPRASAWPVLPQGDVCPSDITELPGRDNFLSIRKFSPVAPLEGCSARWNDTLHRQFYRGSPPSRRGIECLGTSFGVTHMIDLRRPDEIAIDSHTDRFRSEQAAVAEFTARHPDHPMRYFNVRTTRDQPRENQEQIESVVRYVRRILRDEPNAVFYLHCRAGRDRTGVMVAAIESVVGECPWPAVRRRLFSFRFSRSYAEPLLYPLQRAIGMHL